MRILHTMLRVGDLARSIDFYTNVMGMTVLRKTDRPEQKYTLAFVGYGDESRGAVLEPVLDHEATPLRGRLQPRHRHPALHGKALNRAELGIEQGFRTRPSVQEEP